MFGRHFHLPYQKRVQLPKNRSKAKSGLALALTLLTAACVMPLRSDACGLSWVMPFSHFPGTDSRGHVMLGETLGHLELDKNVRLPIMAMFDSSFAAASPFLGRGWQLPILESRVVAVDEESFRLDQPDGWFKMFWKDKKTPGVYHGQGDWKAEVKGARITAWADCGTKLVFDRGRLITMQIGEHVLDYTYLNDRVHEIRRAGVPVLKVQTAPLTGEVTGLLLEGGRRIQIEQIQRPRFQFVNGVTLVNGFDSSVGKITREDGSICNINYPDEEKGVPSIKVNDRLLKWHALSKKILSDGDWSYEVKEPAERGGDEYVISRKNVSGLQESWHRDMKKGVEVVVGSDGVEHTKSWFTSGKVAGLLRSELKVDPSPNGPSNAKTEYMYDESARLMRIKDGQELYELKYERDELGHQVLKVLHNGSAIKVTSSRSDQSEDKPESSAKK